MEAALLCLQTTYDMESDIKMDELKGKLTALGAEFLADALLELSKHGGMAEDMVKRLTTAPKEKQAIFKRKLTGLKRRRSFVSRYEAPGFVNQLETLLSYLKEGVSDPETGAELAASFFDADEAIFESCDDSDGIIGDIFRQNAAELFSHYAALCPDKDWVRRLVLKVCEEDNYGVRDSLIDHAEKYLSENDMQKMADKLWTLAMQKKEKDPEDYRSRKWLYALESIAKQLKDAPLFEKACAAQWPDDPSAKGLDIAKIYFDTGAPETALEWLEKTSDRERFGSNKRNELLLEVYKTLGDAPKASETAWAIFRSNRNSDTLKQLLEVIGEKKREEAVKEAMADILGSTRFNASDAEFLIEAGLMDEAETYITSDPERIDGYFYRGLRPLAQKMEKLKRPLGASVIYRALLDSILERGQSKYYHHGVRYLKRLDELTLQITSWKHIPPHSDYKNGIRKEHGRKRSFWGKYGE